MSDSMTSAGTGSAVSTAPAPSSGGNGGTAKSVSSGKPQLLSGSSLGKDPVKTQASSEKWMPDRAGEQVPEAAATQKIPSESFGDEMLDNEAQPEQEQTLQEELILGKFKSHEEVAKAYQEIEKMATQKAQEAAEMKKYLDYVMQNVQAPHQERQAQPEIKKEPRFFHEQPDEVKRDQYARFVNALGENGENATQVIFEALQNTNAIAAREARKEFDAMLNDPAYQQKLGQMGAQTYAQKAAREGQLSKHIEEVRKQRPDIDKRGSKIVQLLNYAATLKGKNGDSFIDVLEANNISPVIWADDQVLASLTNEEKAAMVSTMQQQVASEAQVKKQAFQLSGQPAQSRIAPPKVEDPTGILRKYGKNAKKKTIMDF